ncbi:MAG TPA: TlpA disulfide reductase family protein [Bacillota bacterium]|jgi:peroxiredoxin|nr:TlpA disulfide reductase family protein [Bacillota bacterium]HRS20181.1 TlpA disulfide reductase family protein [Clostridia bacterium]HRU41705.1 TlpA disulfide reductase family protein [Candidatus Diapherotrites archaeon]HOS69179.1 TlpA disulfide reductase family protein [Bacillota bacterium]HQE65891.1 TlpA disulfide reductase family protein [Bacillota bacterium]
MKKNIIIGIAATILVVMAVYVTKNYNSKAEIVINPPQQDQQAEQPASDPIPSSDSEDNSGEPKINLMDNYDFTLKDLEGNEVKLSSLKGKKVFLNFWATWCPPCKAEMPDIEKLYQETKDSGLVILAINVDTDKKAAQDFIDANNYNFTVLWDENGEVSRLYQVTAIPTSYFIDTEGFLGGGTRGMISLEAMKEYVNNLE